MADLLAIPNELRLLPNWIMWKYEWPNGKDKKPTKVPYQINGNKADVTNPNHWVRFDEAFNCLQFGSYAGLGFVFSNSGYTGIDLDNSEFLPSGEHNPNHNDDHARQLNIFKEFDSYSELSPSGKGLHIIVKGSVPQGRRRSFIEIYSNARYFTMTGNVYHNKPVADRQELLTLLYQQMSAPPKVSTFSGNDNETHTDAEIISQCSNASNGHKFDLLFAGDWQSLYSSQSEADFAIIDIIAFYTQNKNQIIRIFRQSGLGKRDKAKRQDYVSFMVQKSFDRMLPNVDIEGFKIALEEKLAQSKAGSINGKSAPFEGVNVGSNPSPATNGSVAQRLEPSAHNGLVVGSNPTASTNTPLAQRIERGSSKPDVEGSSPSGSAIQPPPGLLGEIAQFIYQSAPRPVPEIALAGAIGFMSGVCGRAYNVSGTGLNQYVLLLANTGTGKEAIASGIDKIVNAVSMRVPVASEFIGPSEIASGQALVKYLSNKSQSFVSILGEFGLRLQSMSDPRANGAERTLKRMLLNLYNKSGHGQVERPSIYADIDKNTNLISSPAFSILGESTPETFYSALTEEMIAEGLLPRFMLIEYNGKRPSLNENHIYSHPSEDLINKVADIIANAKTVMSNRQVVNVNMTDGAKTKLDRFNDLADSKMNSTDKEVTRQLWNRAHIKLLKISALVSIGVNPFNPVIESSYVDWGRRLVEHDIKALSAKFESGMIGQNSDEIKQYEKAKKIIAKYVTEDWDKIKGYSKGFQSMHSAKVIPWVYFGKRLANDTVFKRDRNGATGAIKRTIQSLVDNGFLIENPKNKTAQQFGTSQVSYMIANMSLLDDLIE